MKSIEHQMEALTSTVRQIQRELDSLKSSAYRKSWVHTDTGTGKHVHSEHKLLDSNLAAPGGLELDRNIARYYPNTKVMMLGPDPNDGELFNKVSMGKALKTRVAPLTYRETQILNYIAEGNTNKEIAYILQISDQTIKNHISAIFRKLNANDRAHAVALAMRNSWISTEVKHEDMVAVS